MLGYTSEKLYLQMVSKSTGTEKCPMSPTGITNSRVVYGPGLAGARGKTIGNKLIMVETEKLQIPNNFY